MHRHIPGLISPGNSISCAGLQQPLAVIESRQMQTAHALPESAVSADLSRKPSVQQRYLALDAYRGFIMLILVSGGFGLAELARRRPAFIPIANQFEHMPWEWIAF